MRFFFTLTFLTALSLTQLKAQDSTSVGNNGFGFNFMGSPAYAGITYEALIQNRLGIEFGLGVIGYGGGLCYYYMKPKLNEVSGFVGIKSKNSFLLLGRNQTITYLPIGMSLIGDLFFLSLDVGPAIYNTKSAQIYDPEEPIPDLGRQLGYHGNIKLGIRF